LEPDTPCSCKSCRKKFISEPSLIAHFAIKHFVGPLFTQEHPNQCEVCKKFFKTPVGLEAHKKAVHTIAGVTKVIQADKKLKGQRSSGVRMTTEKLIAWAKTQPQANSVIKPKPPKSITCVLCGMSIPKGRLLEHKFKVHGEEKISRGSGYFGSSGGWVSIWSGGLPGLGKRH